MTRKCRVTRTPLDTRRLKLKQRKLCVNLDQRFVKNYTGSKTRRKGNEIGTGLTKGYIEWLRTSL